MAYEQRERMQWSWSEVVSSTVKWTAMATAASLLIAYLCLLFEMPALLIAGILALIIATPVSFLAALGQQNAKHLKHQLNRASTYDRATGSFTAASFVSEIDRRSKVIPVGKPRQGAMLIVDASHARAVHRRLGSAWGDEPIKVIADAIRSAIRKDDLIGRLDVHTFGIFLPTASVKDAVEIGARIRAAVGKVYYAPEGAGDGLSITIGGVICEGSTDFDTMFKAVANVIETSPNLVSEGVALASLRA